MNPDALVWLACWLSAGIWMLVGLYKVTHVGKMVNVVRAHSIPFPVIAFWLSVAAELGGSVILLFTPYIWVACSIWLMFLVVATPIFHGHAFHGGRIDYQQLVQIGKNLSIAGGLVALMLLDRHFIKFFAG